MQSSAAESAKVRDADPPMQGLAFGLLGPGQFYQPRGPAGVIGAVGATKGLARFETKLTGHLCVSVRFAGA